jgi:hypothetical protein
MGDDAEVEGRSFTKISEALDSSLRKLPELNRNVAALVQKVGVSIDSLVEQTRNYVGYESRATKKNAAEGREMLSKLAEDAVLFESSKHNTTLRDKFADLERDLVAIGVKYDGQILEAKEAIDEKKSEVTFDERD